MKPARMKKENEARVGSGVSKRENRKAIPKQLAGLVFFPRGKKKGKGEEEARWDEGWFKKETE